MIEEWVVLWVVFFLLGAMASYIGFLMGERR